MSFGTLRCGVVMLNRCVPVYGNVSFFACVTKNLEMI